MNQKLDEKDKPNSNQSNQIDEITPADPLLRKQPEVREPERKPQSEIKVSQ